MNDKKRVEEEKAEKRTFPTGSPQSLKRGSQVLRRERAKWHP
jgi:hypothetical protein